MSSNTATVHSDEWDYATIDAMVKDRIQELRTKERLGAGLARQQAISETADMMGTTPEKLADWMARAGQMPTSLDLPINALEQPAEGQRSLLRKMVEGMAPDTMRLIVYDNMGGIAMAQQYLGTIAKSLGWATGKGDRAHETQTLPAQRNGQPCFILKVVRLK